MNHRIPADQGSFPLPEVDPRDEAAMGLLGHDLRAALADVTGGIGLIDAGRLDPDLRIQLDRVRASGAALARLLEKGLAVMLGEAPAAARESLALNGLLSELDMRWTGRAAARGLAFHLTAAADLPENLMLDHLALERVLANLIGNAIKFTERGRVTCGFARHAGGGLAIAVSDQGPGFPASVLGRAPVFHRRPATETKPGSGMGLHIAQALADQMGGRLLLRNLQSGGAEATLILPLESDARVQTPERAAQSGLNVLIADDNPTSQAVLAQMLAAMGARVTQVADGLAALQRLRDERFDLLIIDGEMPLLSGAQVLQILRATPGPLADLPAIAVTALGRRSDRIAITAAGAGAVLSKPDLTAQGLAAAVAQVLRQPISAPASMVTETPVMDDTRFQHLLDLAGPQTAEELIYRLLIDLQAVKSAMIKAAAGPDWPAVRAQTHVLISLAGAVGGLRLQACAEAMNHLAQQTGQTLPFGAVTEMLDLIDGLCVRVSEIHASQTASP